MKRKTRKTGLIVQPDDFEVGQFYTVYGLKHSPDQPVQIAGLSFRLKAVNLPFLVGQLTVDPANPITIDCRQLSIMRVSVDYVAAQDSPEKSGGCSP